jgi:DNA-binding IclR family transcriptional regulator
VARLHAARRQGHATVHEVYEAGTSSLAVPIRDPNDGLVVGTVSIAGPEARLKPERMLELLPLVSSAAVELAQNAAAIRLAAK